MKRALLAMALLAHAAGALGAGGPDDAYWKKSAAQLLKGIENEHPAAYYIVASKLFEEGKKQDAVFWFYAGQLRYRFHLAANPGLPPDGDPALFGSLSEVVGRPINEWAFGDLDALVATLDKVLAWDAKSANGYTSKEKHATEWNDIRAGLGKMKQYVVDNAATIRRDRAANGLENRTAKPAL